ncbi:alpha-beta hydrolase superfamily lysophospholipase [Marisediminicola sp. UYEF4]|uniref:alpha/beta hydrolase n=1 Tax=Marisediminicola sp. UYEF4 TaxID=1756384 RepID=UPI003395F0B7
MADSGRHADHRPPWWSIVIFSVSSLAAMGGAITALMTLRVAQLVVTPPRSRPDDVPILDVDRHAHTVTLGRTADSATPGRYGLWFSRDSGHARLGEVTAETDGTVTRELLGVDFGELLPDTRGRFSGWFFLTPRDLGVDHESVSLVTTLGPAPAWVILADRDEHGTATGKWAVLVHGRGVTRSETLRCVGVFREAGYNCLLVSWRNDGDAPPSDDRRYALGATEWLDVEAGIRYAHDERGATDVVLVGFSMGGAAVLQAAANSELATLVRGIVLESPVVDWAPTLLFQARVLRVPRLVQRAAISLLGSRRAHRITGLRTAIDFRMLDFVLRSDELTVPVLLMHSDDDGYVPPTASRALASARPDIVTFHLWRGARHARLWNYDPVQFTAQIGQWLATLPLGGGPATSHTGRSDRPPEAG